MKKTDLNQLNQLTTFGATITPISDNGLRLTLSDKQPHRYCVAQLDDYKGLTRSAFYWKPPLDFKIRARASGLDIPGTWGFGFWNDPFNINLKLCRDHFKIPSLPNAIWFFFASQHNYLSLYEHLPANGKLIAIFNSKAISSLWIFSSIPLITLSIHPVFRKVLRKILRLYIKQDGCSIPINPILWNEYQISWQLEKVEFFINGKRCFTSTLLPTYPLGLVIWIDNQYFAFPANGEIKFGNLPTSQSNWIEVEGLAIK